MAITFDNADSGAEVSVSATLTLSFTVGSGSNMVLCVLATQATAQVNIDGATYNGVDMTANTQYTTGGIRNIRFFHLLNPDAGTHDLVVSYASASSQPMAVISSWQGVASLENITNANANSTSMSWTIASESGDVVGALMKGNASDTLTWTSPATELLDEDISTIGRAGVASEDGAASVTIDGTKTNGAWGGTAFNMNASSEANQAAEFAGDFSVGNMIKNIVVT